LPCSRFEQRGHFFGSNTDHEPQSLQSDSSQPYNLQRGIEEAQGTTPNGAVASAKKVSAPSEAAVPIHERAVFMKHR
jgi:hypothetical protein